MNKENRKKLYFWLIYFMSIISVFVLWIAHAALTYNDPKAEKGIINLNGYNFKTKGPICLNGQWEFYWNKLLTPDDFEKDKSLEPTGYLNVPGLWRKDFDRAKLPGEGYSTCRLKIILPTGEAGKPFGIRSTYISSAYRLFADNRLVMNSGLPGKTRDSTLPSKKVNTAWFIPESSSFYIIADISNFHLRNGGFKRPIIFGLQKEIDLLKIFHTGESIFVIFFLLSLISYNLFQYFFRVKERHFLYFSLLCFFTIIREMCVNERILYIIFPDISWNLFNGIDYGSFMILVIALSFYNLSLIPKYVSLKITYITSAFLLILLIIPFLFPSYEYLKYIRYTSMLILIAIVYQVICVFNAYRHDRDSTLLIYFVSSIVLVLAILCDIVIAMGDINAMTITTFGLLKFALVQTIFLHKGFSLMWSLNKTQDANG